ncbi:MAG TPA: GNAT family N-acetyltransferase [Jiangellaceae bacterium]
MGSGSRRFAALTLDNLADIGPPCRSCVFWELDLAESRAEGAADPELEKEAWFSAVLLEWGSCGMVAYLDDTPMGYITYAPPTFVPRSGSFPTSPISADAVQLVTARVPPDLRGQGVGRALVQTAARSLGRRGIKAIEAFGDARHDVPSCLLPADFLRTVGFKTIRPHRVWPRLRLDLRTTVTLSEEVEVALDRIMDLVHPDPVPRPV